MAISFLIARIRMKVPSFFIVPTIAVITILAIFSFFPSIDFSPFPFRTPFIDATSADLSSLLLPSVSLKVVLAI